MSLSIHKTLLSWAGYFLACHAATPRVVQPLWSVQTSDCKGCLPPLGPDGPWQAILIEYPNLLGNTILPSYPDDQDFSYLLSRPVFGNLSGDTGTLRTIDGVLNSTGNGAGTKTILGIRTTTQFVSTDVNASLAVLDSWSIGLPDGRNYPVNVSSLGLYAGQNDSVIGQLKARQLIDTNGWSIHVGSVPLQLPGSCMLGGYDANRVIGDAAVFNIDLAADGNHLFLVDAVLGVEKGASPFPPGEQITATEPRSVWDGGSTSNVELGAPYGAFAVNVRPSYPGIYLPKQNCANIAKRLPVTWRSDIGYYIWNVDDTRYKNIITSPSYLAFVLSDRTAKNVTIKVPFALLNLTLESPIVDKPLQYLPCHPADTAWLGRAFLQAAFYAANYDTNTAYLAQAPGPKVKQSIVQTLPSNSSSPLVTISLEEFAKSWDTVWSPLPDVATVSSTPSSSSPSSLSGGAIAGIVIGVLVGVGAIVAIALTLWRRKNKANTSAITISPAENEKVFEVHPTSSNIHEISSKAVVKELGTDNQHYSRVIIELEGN